MRVNFTERGLLEIGSVETRRKVHVSDDHVNLPCVRTQYKPMNGWVLNSCRLHHVLYIFQKLVLFARPALSKREAERGVLEIGSIETRPEVQGRPCAYTYGHTHNTK